jgi:hypothetical protein
MSKTFVVAVAGAAMLLSAGAVQAAGPVVKSPVDSGVGRPKRPQGVLRTIPKSLKWTCSAEGLGEYKCTDPATGKDYLCTAPDPDTGDRVCDVGSDTIPGSKA